MENDHVRGSVNITYVNRQVQCFLIIFHGGTQETNYRNE